MDNLTEEQQKQYDKWTKDDIYIAYMSENKSRIWQTERANESDRRLKEVEWELKQLLKKIISESL